MEASSNWRCSTRKALLELAFMVGLAAVVIGLASWVTQPFEALSPTPDATGCERIVEPVPDLRLQIALPGTGAPPLLGVDEIVKCYAPASLSAAIRSSVRRDLVLVPFYVLWLALATARLGGFDRLWRPRSATRLQLACVSGNEAGRLVGAVAMWSAIAAGFLDVVENAGLLHTAGRLDGPSTVVVQLTAGAAIGKWLLLVLPVALGLFYLVKLLASAVPSRMTEPIEHEVAIARSTSFTGSTSPRWMVPARRCAKPHVHGLDEHCEPLQAALPANNEEYGICLSGGGIRSATFGLGALQELEEVQGPWGLRKARYLSAVSGGSYIASTYQFLAYGARSADPTRDQKERVLAPSAARRLFARVKALPADANGAASRAGGTEEPSLASSDPLVPPTGAVEDHLRRHATHLADGAREWIASIGEIALRLVQGLAMLVLAVWAVGVPLGWGARYVFHGLRAGEPTLHLDGRLLAMLLSATAVLFLLRYAATAADRLRAKQLAGDGSRPGATRRSTVAQERSRAAMSYGLSVVLVIPIVMPIVALHLTDATTRVGRVLGIESGPPPDASVLSRHVDAIIAGTSRAAVAAAAAATAGESAAAAAASLDTSVRAAELAGAQARAAVLELAGDPTGSEPESRPVAFDPDTCRPLEAALTPDERERNLSIRACRASLSARAAVLAVEAVARATSRGVSTETAELIARSVSSATAGAAAASRAVRALAVATSGVAPPAEPAAPPVGWAGLTGLVTVIGGLLAKRRLDVAKGPAVAGARAKRLAASLGFGSIVEVVAGVVTTLVLVAALSDVVVDSWQRGISGRLAFGITWQAWQWWLAVVAALLAVLVFVNVNRWSLRPFYHRRLWLPYAVTRQGRTADWDTDTRLSEAGRRVDGLPELLICAAVQTSGREAAPPGRRALPYVFSAEACGGPDVGYVATPTLELLLRRHQRSSITLFGAMATSGAAISPAMGRMSKGGFGALMAIANARLGVWLPNPRHLGELASAKRAGARLRRGAFVRWPRLWYWLMEIVGQYPRDAKLALVTDGGHVENLGLVELLRRRCSRILCFDASGAGATPTTLAQAIVLARDELGVEITLDPLPGEEAEGPDAARAATDASATPGGPAADGDRRAARRRSLLALERSGADPLQRKAGAAEHLAERLAGRPVLTATISYPPLEAGGKVVVPEAKGVLVYGTLALVDGGPGEWDVLEYAQRNAVFPGDGTLRQWFDADTFSAYQQLGRRTAQRMLELAADLGVHEEAETLPSQTR